MIQADDALAIEDHDRGRGADAITLVVRDAHRDWNAGEERIVLVPHRLHVAEFFLWARRRSARDVAESLGRRDDREPFGLVLGVELREDWAFDLAVRAPVRP